jgi:hypothetical protein
MRGALWLLTLGLGVIAARHAPALTISDDAFLEGDWSASEISDTGGTASFTTSQQVAGGNPGSFRQTTHSIPDAGQSIVLAHLFTEVAFDPGISASIAAIDFALDLRFIGGSVGTSQVGHQLLLAQGGSLYRAPSTASAVALGPGNGLPGSWSSHSFAGLVAGDFVRASGSGPATPDFSASGDPIQFGYLTQNTSIDTAIATTSGVDNWRVEIHVPEPSAAALLAAPLVALAARTRRACRRRLRVEDSR